jgi:methanogen homocitrate synthase
VAALLKEPRTVEAFGPELLGRGHQIELGKKSGKANIIWKIDQMNLEPLPADKVEKLLESVKRRASETKSALSEEEFLKLYQTV